MHIYNTWGTNYVVEVSFQLASKWSKWCAQTTLNPFFSDFENFPGHWRTNRSASYRQFSNLFHPCKVLFFPEKAVQTASKSAYKHRRYLLLNNATASLVTVKRPSVICKKSQKHHTSTFHADMRRSISTIFCMMIEDLRAIIAPL